MELIDFLTMCAYFSVSSLLGIIGINSPQAYRPILFVGLASFAILAFGQISSRIWGAEVFRHGIFWSLQPEQNIINNIELNLIT